MDICSHHVMSVSEDVKSFHELAVDPHKSAREITGDLLVNDLENNLTNVLSIRDGKKLLDSIIPSDKNEVEKEDTHDDVHQCKLASLTSEKCLSKCATFPCSGKLPSFDASITGVKDDGEKDAIIAEVLAQNDYAKSVPSYPRSMSLPTPLKPVSAMKGSREKQGKPPKKLTVTWAPDVYDPPPTAASHVATNKTQRHRNYNKKNGKNKQKGVKPSRGSRSKDKKQVRKHGGNSYRGSTSLDDHDRMVDRNEPLSGLVDFDIGSPDPFCGSSFLKKSVKQVHFSVAEAT